MNETYYNNLSAYYKLIYTDWDASVKRQADDLDGVIREFSKNQPKTILDVACGIGTQSIGLSTLGYQVTGSDLSSVEVELAQAEAQNRGLDIEFNVGDMRKAWDIHQDRFDVVIACDNSIPHLPDEEQIAHAIKQFNRCLKPGGLCLVSVRDYSQMQAFDRETRLYPRTVHQTESGRLVLLDVWQFEGNSYEITTYVIEDRGEDFVNAQVVRGGKYFMVDIPTLEKLFHEAGFQEVITLYDRYFQPLIVAKK
jgi:2-polyprenyl-3-methyl-5-hydroxy-6-metoxy-1,4-benzoquinol methylase